MQKARGNNLIIATHVQDDSFFSRGIVNGGTATERLDSPPVTELTETTQIARGLLSAQKTGVHYRIYHVSTKTGVELVRLAKTRGINATCEITPHRILLTDNGIPEDNGYFRISSLLRSKEDQVVFLVGLLDGITGLTATDHAPHAEKEKQGGMKDAALGITGNETVFSTLYIKFMEGEETLRFEQLLALLNDRPVKVLGIKSTGVLEPGRDADIVISGTEHKIEIKEADFKSKGVNTPLID